MSKRLPTDEKELIALIKEKAALCKNRTEFSRKFSNLYNAARIKGMLNLIPKYKGKYTDDFLITTAKKYTHRSEWAKKEPNTYAVTCQRGLLNKACQHMVSTFRVYTQE